MKKYRYINLAERKQIAEHYESGDRVEDIAACVGIPQASVYRELQRGYTGLADVNNRPAYDPILAQERLQQGFKRRGRKRIENSRCHNANIG